MTDHLLVESEDMGEGIRVAVRYEEHDMEHANPRDATNLGVMFCDYRGYNLGDDDAPDPRDAKVDCKRCEGNGWVPQYEGSGKEADEDGEVSCPVCGGDGEESLDIFEYLKREHGARVVLPLFVYEHSGITMSSGENMGSFNPRGRNAFDSAAWDTSTVGVIFDTADSRVECGCEDFTDEQIIEGLEAEVKLYAAYLEGRVFWYAVEDTETDETLDSCGGFLDEEKYAMDEGKASAEHYVAERRSTRERNELALASWRY